jgi:hypothetical protein
MLFSADPPPERHHATPRLPTAGRSTTKDGLEAHMGTNHLAHFLLTLGLLPALRRGAATDAGLRRLGGARVVHVASSMLMFGRGLACDDPTMELPGSYSAEVAYGRSKLAQVGGCRLLWADVIHCAPLSFAAHALKTNKPRAALSSIQAPTLAQWFCPCVSRSPALGHWAAGALCARAAAAVGRAGRRRPGPRSCCTPKQGGRRRGRAARAGLRRPPGLRPHRRRAQPAGRGAARVPAAHGANPADARAG